MADELIVLIQGGFRATVLTKAPLLLVHVRVVRTSSLDLVVDERVALLCFVACIESNVLTLERRNRSA